MDNLLLLFKWRLQGNKYLEFFFSNFNVHFMFCKLILNTRYIRLCLKRKLLNERNVDNFNFFNEIPADESNRKSGRLSSRLVGQLKNTQKLMIIFEMKKLYVREETKIILWKKETLRGKKRAAAAACELILKK